MSKLFVVQSLLAAGFTSPDPAQAALIRATATDANDPGATKLFQQYRQDHLFTLAGHRSHRSHSSHSSHRSGSSGHYSHSSHTSHYSSTGGTAYPSPAPVYTPPSPRASPTTSRGTSTSGSSSSSSSGASGSYGLYGDGNGTASSNSDASLPALSGRTPLFKTIVMHVQVALMGQGLFDGPIDGTVGPKTRAALRAYQSTHNLTPTGTITNETLDALHVPSQLRGD